MPIVPPLAGKLRAVLVRKLRTCAGVALLFTERTRAATAAPSGEEELVRLHLVTATTDLDARRAVPIPPDLRAALAAYQARCRDG